MIAAYKEYFQFIILLSVMYVAGVWFDPIIYVIFPLVFIMFGLKGYFFQLFIMTLWLLILSDYVPVENATYADLQFAKDLKPLLPILLLFFFYLNRDSFKPYSKVFQYFLPFLLVATIALINSTNITVGIQKTISFALMYLLIPIYTLYLHRSQKELFWRSLMTFIIGMLTIGMVLKFAVPDIGMLAGGRFKGILGNPNGLGIFLNLTFILWVVVNEMKLATFTRKEKQYVLFVIFVSLLWCGSRNAMMSIFLFYLIFKLVRINWFIAVIAVVAFLTFSEVLFEGFISGVEFFGLEEYFRVESIEEGSGRKIAWFFAWTQIQDYFIIGGGFGNDEHVMRPNYGWLAMEGHQGGVHNSYLSMWFDAGLVGLILYFGGFLFLAVKVMKNNYLVIAFTVSICVNITYESWLVASLNPFTILFLIILTIFVSNMQGSDYVQNEMDVMPKNEE